MQFNGGRDWFCHEAYQAVWAEYKHIFLFRGFVSTTQSKYTSVSYFISLCDFTIKQALELPIVKKPLLLTSWEWKAVVFLSAWVLPEAGSSDTRISFHSEEKPINIWRVVLYSAPVSDSSIVIFFLVWLHTAHILSIIFIVSYSLHVMRENASIV